MIDPSRTPRKQLLKELGATVAELRQEAKEKGLDKISKREIDAAVAAARRDLKRPRAAHQKLTLKSQLVI